MSAQYEITLSHAAYGRVRETVEARSDRAALRHAGADQRSHGYGWSATVRSGERLVGHRPAGESRWQGEFR